MKENRGNEVMNILKIFKTETGERCSAVAT